MSASTGAIRFRPLAAAPTRPITSRISEAATPVAIVIMGATTRAVTTFDSTVSWSDTGSDFQNRMLRSRRSSYSAARQ